MRNPGIGGEAGPGFRFTQSGLRLLRNAGALTHLDDKPAATKGKSKSKA